MMNHWKKTAVMLLLTVMLATCLISPAMARGGLSVFSYMKTYTEGENLEILWYTIDGADHYECTIKCGSSYLRNRSRTDSYYACYLDGSRVKAGSYKVWVGAIDGSGNTIADGIIYFTVNEKDDCDHRWDEDTGSCSRCDAECPHNTGYYEVEYKSVGKSISSTQHRITDTYRKECKTCRYVLEKGLTKTSTGKHSFDSNGDCKLCDYRAACKHSDKELVPHDPTYTQYDATYHKKKVVSDLVCANANCGKVIAYSDDVTTTKQKHTMVDDRCKYCGYTVEYEDVTVSVARDSSTGYVGQSIGAVCTPKGGTGSYSYAWYVYCDGAEVYSTTSWDKRGSYSPTRAGSYTFKVYVTDRKNGDSASATSGTIKVTNPPCAHAVTSEVRKAGSETYSKLSDSRHNVSVSYDVVCSACGEVVNTIKRTAAEDHTYSGSNCTGCGAAKPVEACTHQKMTSSELKRSARKTESDTYHYVDIVWQDVCASCGVTLNTTRKTTERADHAYSGNTCTLCGYVRIVQCDHADKTRESLGSTTVRVDDQRHVVTTTYRVTCASCDEVLNAALKEDAYFAHTMENGKCRYCMHTAPVVCAHEEQNRTALSSVVRMQDERNHVVTTTYRVTCTACRAVIAEGVKEDTTAPHNMADGQCPDCGYAEAVACTHPEQTRVSQGSVTRQENGQKHVVTTTYCITCADCGVVIDPAREEHAYFDHTMDNGVCRYCGFAEQTDCTHVLEIRSEEKTSIERNYADDENTHVLVTTWTMSCACGAVTQEQSSRQTVAHKYTYHGYEQEHFHQLFDRCACGVVRFPGGYHTVNGVVYEEYEVPDDTKCCVCLGHQWNVDEPFQLNGEWQNICSNCKQLRVIEKPVGAGCPHDLDMDALVDVVDLYEIRNIDDRDSHSVSKAWHSEGVCKLCGTIYKVGYCHVTTRDPHHFDDQGVCSDCGYVATTSQYGIEKRYQMYIESDYNVSDLSSTFIGVNERETVYVYDRYEDRYMPVRNSKLQLRLKDDGGIATLDGDLVRASNSGTFVLALYDKDILVDELTVGVTLLSVEDSFFEYSYASSGAVRMDDMSNIDWDDCNVLLTGAVSIGEYSQTKLSNGSMRVSFNAYNSSAVVVGVAVYDVNGSQLSMQLIESYWGTGSFVEDAYRNIVATGRVWDSKSFNGQNTTKTPVTLTVPAGGYIRVMEMHDDGAVFAANVAESLLGTVKYYNDAESLVNPVNLKEMESLLESLGKDEFYLATYNYLVRHYGHDFTDLLIGTAELTGEAVDMSMILEALLADGDDFIGEIVGSIPGAVGSLVVDKTEDALLSFVPGMYHAKHGFQMAHDTVGMYQLFDSFDRCMLDEQSGKIVSYIIAPEEKNLTPEAVDTSAVTSTRYAISSVDTVLRNVPSMKYAYYTFVPAGAELELLGSSTDREGNVFYEVRYGYSRGYVLASESRVQDFGYKPTQTKFSIKESDVKHRTVSVTHNANLRVEADAYSTYVQRVFVGETLKYLGEKNGWYKVMSPGDTPCYIYAGYAELND
ncbi:MAG: hypothetical protein IJ343_05135 [Clostridia bacterium]|nr:hypothetical protein [Clostridia bacterium]